MLERCLVALVANPQVSIVYTDQEWFGDTSRIVQTTEFRPRLLPLVNEFAYCALYRSEVWDAVGGYNTNMKGGYEDWDFWLGCVEAGLKARRLPEPLFRYRVRSGSMHDLARQRHGELLARLRGNHPALYRTWPRLQRAVEWKATQGLAQVGSFVRRTTSSVS
jgi:hypothetical protein